ncbi:MAG: cysteine desulfurase [Alphaproteobacteria bacterium]|nr:MAG: cysteine desulfurase [Alphaproteobacteria bacterium]
MRRDFPILDKKTDGRSLIYFDNAATAQKPYQVILAITKYYETANANVHRGIYDLSEESTKLYEQAREKVAKFVNAKSAREIIFVRNTTEAINLLAFCLGGQKEITTTIMEHHSNLLPWKRVTKKLNIIDINDKFELARPVTGEFVTMTQASNVLGTINAIPRGGTVIVDGAQAISHNGVDVQKLGCSAYAFSGHKMYGPQGVGVLYIKEELIRNLPAFLVGGGMVGAKYPQKFEAGTPDIAGAVGLTAAIDYLKNVGFEEIEKYEKLLTNKLIMGLKEFKELKVYGPKDRVPVVSFNVSRVHPHDVAQFLNDRYNIAVRAGHHCCMPLHERLGVRATVRASLAFYNTEEEIDIFIEAIKELVGSSLAR